MWSLLYLKLFQTVTSTDSVWSCNTITDWLIQSAIDQCIKSLHFALGASANKATMCIYTSILLIKLEIQACTFFCFETD